MEVSHLSTAMVLMEVGPFRLLTDPTFDPKGTRYHFGPFANSSKTQDTAWTVSQLEARGDIDAVLISHHHHTDNLDYLGRALLERPFVKAIVTHDRWPEDLRTLNSEDLQSIVNGDGRRFGSDRWTRPLNLSDRLITLGEFQAHQIERDGTWLKITCVPALHGRYEDWSALRPFSKKLFSRRTVGFLLECQDDPGELIYISGDTIMFEGINRIRRHVEAQGARINVAFMHGGCVGFAVLDAMGFGPHTFDGRQMVAAAKLLQPRTMIPIHYDGWAHFRQSRDALATVLHDSELESEVLWLSKGSMTTVDR